jgi:GAF domain-containing protein
VAREAATELDLSKLLERAVSLISERFGYYHASIFLMDSTREWAVLQAASSEGGRRMLERLHRLRRGVGIVGHVVAEGKSRVASDVGEDAAYFDNPDLPQTHSEMALPLQVRGETIGALDVQSTERDAFDDEDVGVMQGLADQIAVAISNARLFQQAQESLEAERRAYGEVGRLAWQGLLAAEGALGCVRDSRGITLEVGELEREARAALETGSVMQSQEAAGNVAVPIKVHGKVIGVIDAQKRIGATPWTNDQVNLLQAFSDQLSLALDSARLYQTTQRRAAEDRLVGEITARIRETLDVDTVLQTAVREMGEALGVAKVEVRLGAGPAVLEADGQSEVEASAPGLPKEHEYAG